MTDETKTNQTEAEQTTVPTDEAANVEAEVLGDEQLDEVAGGYRPKPIIIVGG